MTFEEMLDKRLRCYTAEAESHTERSSFIRVGWHRLDAVKDESLFAHAEITDEDGRGLVWTSEIPTSAQNA